MRGPGDGLSQEAGSAQGGLSDGLFLQQCILYDESTGRQELEEIAQIQRNARAVQRAAWVMAVLSALVVAGLYLSGVFAGEPSRERAAIHREPVCALGVGSLIEQLLAFAGLGMSYRQGARCTRRQESFQMVARLLESRLGKPLATPLLDIQDGTLGDSNAGTGPVAAAANGSP